MNKSLSNKKTIIWFMFILGVLFIIIGSVLVVLSFKNETIGDKYHIKEATNYQSKKSSIEKGEIIVTKDIKYISNGEYQIIYKNYMKKSNNISLLEEGSNFTITDILGDDYALVKNKIYINDKLVKLENNQIITENYDVVYNNNTFEVSFPSSNAERENTVKINVKLTGNKPNVKYAVSKDSYYSLTPSSNNDFYNKKSMQSYIIEGNSYIVLKEIK